MSSESSSVLQVVPVETSRQRKDFLHVPWSVNKSDPLWIPPLLMAVEQSLDTKKNPFYKHAELKLWVAYRSGRAVGRMAGIIDENHNKFHEELTGFWGFFDCENDQQATNALFKEVESWAKSHGMTTLRGPVSPSTNHECGLQISAFDTKPYIMMTQNQPYYADLVERAGYSKAKDLYAWVVDHSRPRDERLVKFAQRILDRNGVTIRPIKMADYEAEVNRILEIYNDAWEKNWGFVPMNEEEFRYMAKDMKGIVVPDMLFIAEVKGEPAAFSLFLPDLNQVMEKIPSGRLLPTGFLKLLWYTKINKKFVNRGRVLTLGVKQKFRSYGIAPALYMRYLTDGPRLGFPQAECSWILEDNKAMAEGLKLMKAEHYKTYRIYDKVLV